MVNIQFNSIAGLQPICGGAIINTTHVVTAAHCADFEIRDLLLVAGAYNIKELEPSQQRKTPKSIYMHPEYQTGDLIRHDLALIEVSTPFVFNTWVQPLPLPAERHNASGYCYIAGWGQTQDHPASDVLLKAIVPILDREECRRVYPDHLDKDNQICAGYPEGGVDVCTGDTGGPLMCSDLGHLYLAGIASWGYKCAVPGYPGVYTEISFYTKSITEHQRTIEY
jgi:secreted trypsin-like serine protease